ncbi:hypothetical protein [Streptomyces sp. NPDC057877]|uniref:hypothetical protein n=1 Tax=Streptomyces sp. NPDC057877 TaxID=3346269 RepID=UPI0036951A7A
MSASRAYIRTLDAHQAAALAGDRDAIRAVREARTLLALAAPELEQLRRVDPEQRQTLFRRTIV